MPPNGLRSGDVLLRFPSLEDVDGILPAFTDPELREAGNLPTFDRAALVASVEELPALAEQGRLLAHAAVDSGMSDVLGGGTLHHLDVERGMVEIGYFVLPHARRRGVATKIARLLADHAFALGIARAAAYVKRRQHRLRACGRAGRLHAGRRRPFDAETRRAARRQDAVLTPSRGMTRRYAR